MEFVSSVIPDGIADKQINTYFVSNFIRNMTRHYILKELQMETLCHCFPLKAFPANLKMLQLTTTLFFFSFLFYFIAETTSPHFVTNSAPVITNSATTTFSS
jgi:hypothetical protein